MVSWLIIVALVLILIIFLKVRTFQHKFYLTLIIVLVLFFYITGSRVIAQNNIDVNSFDGMVSATKVYFSWLGSIFTNTKALVGNAINMDWDSSETTPPPEQIEEAEEVIENTTELADEAVENITELEEK